MERQDAIILGRQMLLGDRSDYEKEKMLSAFVHMLFDSNNGKITDEDMSPGVTVEFMDDLVRRMTGEAKTSSDITEEEMVLERINDTKNRMMETAQMMEDFMFERMNDEDTVGVGPCFPEEPERDDEQEEDWPEEPEPRVRRIRKATLKTAEPVESRGDIYEIIDEFVEEFAPGRFRKVITIRDMIEGGNTMLELMGAEYMPVREFD